MNTNSYFSAIMREMFLLFIGLSFLSGAMAQTDHPKDYFINPMDIPLVLSGTFGELRSNHFHAGLDIKTQQKEGVPVLASADGYISRINVSLWGYGNALYVTHPNGFTTVYGHLKEFSNEIDAYVRKKQYEKESFTIRLYPKAGELEVKQGQVIALSGNSGSSGGPHLHYEIRDVKQDILNPLDFGIEIPDHKKPSIQTAFAYSRNDTSQVNQSNREVQLVLNRKIDGDLQANTIYAYGEIGFGINAYDRLDGALNRNGLYELQMSVDGKSVFKFRADKFSFSESRWINSYVDYQRLASLRQRVQKCFVDHKQNKLSLYKELSKNGFVNIKDSTQTEVVITAKDYVGNFTRLIIPVVGKKDTIAVKRQVEKTPYFFRADQVNQIKDSVVSVYFPKDIFYEDFYFDYGYEDGVARLHNSSVPVHNYFKLVFDVSGLDPTELKQTYISKKNRHGKWYYVSTKKKENTLYTSSKTLGEFKLSIDNQFPKISAVGFKEGQWLAKYERLQVKIYDRGSGIRSYRGELDGEWIRMAYNPKNGTLTYDFTDRELKGTEHLLKVVVADNVNNKTTFKIKFNKKN